MIRSHKMDNITLRFKISVVDTNYGGQVVQEVIKKEIEVPFVPVDNIVYIDGARKYRIRKPEFHPDDWDERNKVIVFGCWLNNIVSSEKQPYLDDGWEVE